MIAVTNRIICRFPRLAGCRRFRGFLRIACGSSCTAISLLVAFSAVGPTVRPIAAQESPGVIQIEVGVAPDSVLIGEPFRAVLRITGPADITIEYGDSVSGDSIFLVEPPRLSSTPNGQMAVYTLTAWRVGPPQKAVVPVRLRRDDGVEVTREVALRMPDVIGVLPDAGVPVGPRPLRGLHEPGPARAIRPLWFLLILLGALAAAAFAWYRLREEVAMESGLTMAPADWALHQLDGDVIRDAIAAGDLVAFHQRLAWILRTFVYHLDPALGPELTTTELLEKMRFAEPEWREIDELARILRVADAVKFARYVPEIDTVQDLLQAARAWVHSVAVSSDTEPSRAA